MQCGCCFLPFCILAGPPPPPIPFACHPPPSPKLVSDTPLAVVCLLVCSVLLCVVDVSSYNMRGKQLDWGVEAGPSNFQQAAQVTVLAITPPDAAEQLEQHVR